GYRTRDITVDMRGLLEPPVVEHHASITDPRGVAQLLRAIEAYSDRRLTQLALKLSPHVFVRPFELRKAEREHFDLAAGEWRSRMTLAESVWCSRSSHRSMDGALCRYWRDWLIYVGCHYRSRWTTVRSLKVRCWMPGHTKRA